MTDAIDPVEQPAEPAESNVSGLRATANAEGAMTEKGTIKRSWLEEHAKGDSTTSKRARLALKLRGQKK